MSFHLLVKDKFDVFYFNQNSTVEPIEFIFPVKSLDLIHYLQASLSQVKCVFIVNDVLNIKKLNIDKCKSKHCLISKDNYIFLNVSLRNHLKKVSTINTQFASYHQVEDFFAEEIINLI